MGDQETAANGARPQRQGRAWTEDECADRVAEIREGNGVDVIAARQIAPMTEGRWAGAARPPFRDRRPLDAASQPVDAGSFPLDSLPPSTAGHPHHEGQS